MNDKAYAVISGEIADSRKIGRDHLGSIPDIIRSCFGEVNQKLDEKERLVFEIIRMDEFLCLTTVPKSALQSILMLAGIFRHKAQHELQIRSELRLSVGIGPIELFQNELRESDGTAIRFADAGLRSMRRNQRLLITTSHEEINNEFQVACTFMDILVHDWSNDQAEAVFHHLSGKNQVEISEELGISQPAVNRRLKAAHMEAIENFVHRYQSLMD
jgi:hypothetical protein